MHGWAGLLLGPSEAGSTSVAQTEVGESAIQLCACLLQTALFSLGLHWGFTVSYLDSNTLTKALLSMDGSESVVAEAGIQARGVLFCHIADVTP